MRAFFKWVRITPEEFLLCFRHIHMIVYDFVEGILKIFIFSRFFHVFSLEILQKSCISQRTRLRHNWDVLDF